MEEVRLEAGGREEDVWGKRIGTVQVIDCSTREHRPTGLPGGSRGFWMIPMLGLLCDLG